MLNKVFFLTLFCFIFACSHKEEPARSIAENQPPRENIHYTTVVFSSGKSTLNLENKERLQELTKKAHKSLKPIEEIRILAWPDNEYPDAVKGKGTQREILLASERAENIRDFLEKNLKEDSDIDAYNMAKRPNLISELFKNDEYKVKEAFETAGMTGDKLPDGNVSYTKASKALIIIDYEGSGDDLTQ